MFPRHQRRRSPAVPEQLELPLDYSRSESAFLSRNPELWKARRRRRWQERPGRYPAIPELPDIAPVSFPTESEKKPPTSTIFVDTNAVMLMGQRNRVDRRLAVNPTGK